MSNDKNIQELLKSTQPEINRIASEVWNNEDFFNLCDVLALEICTRLVETFPNFSHNDLRISATNAYYMVFQSFAQSILDSLRGQEVVILPWHGKEYYFRMT